MAEHYTLEAALGGEYGLDVTEVASRMQGLGNDDILSLANSEYAGTAICSGCRAQAENQMGCYYSPDCDGTACY